MSNYDDLAFQSEKEQKRILCVRCHAAIMVDVDSLECPSCGSRLLDIPAPASEQSQDDMLQAIFQGLQLGGPQFITPSNTMAEMMRAQRGVNVDELISQLLHTDSSNAPPTSTKFLDNIKPFPLTQKDFVQVCLAVEGLKRPLLPTHANFGSSLILKHKMGGPASQDQFSAHLVTAEPFDGHKTLDNALAVAGKCAFMLRGKVNFVQKCRNAQKAGAVAALVAQSDELWPYIMGDDAKQGGGIEIPCLMVSLKDRQAIENLFNGKSVPVSESQTSSSSASLEVKSNASDPSQPRKELLIRVATQEKKLACPVCQDDFAVGNEVVRLPCLHFFHDECIRPWLEKRNTCALCRFELPTDKPKPKGPDQDNQAYLERHMFG